MFAGLPVADMLLIELLLTFVGFAALACFVAASCWPLAALYFAGAIAIGIAGLPTGPVVAVVYTAAIVLFARQWRHVLLASARPDLPPPRSEPRAKSRVAAERPFTRRRGGLGRRPDAMNGLPRSVRRGYRPAPPCSCDPASSS